ncbi:MAG: hypothetical protein J6M95_03830 [Bacilli bacterium]|nr:hypothetical protein [Bacilli bacterium]
MFKRFHLPFLLAVGVAPLLVGSTFDEIKAQYVSQNSVSAIEFHEFYDLNEVIEIPTLVKSGLAYSSSVEFPDGSATKETSVKLNMVGKYIVHYTARSGERYLSEDYSFIVKNQSFVFSGTNSFASYEKSEQNYNKEGLFVALAQGETFTYLRTLNLKNITETSKIIQLYVCPAMVANIDFSTLIFTFTDVNDPHCQLKVKVVASPDGLQYPWSYWSVKGQNQDVFVGLEGSNNIHAGDPYGCPTLHSFYGYYSNYASGNCGDYMLSFSYNSSSKIAYANNSLIADLDSKRFFNYLWDGFTTGEVSLSIEADNYGSDYARFNILQILDTDLSQTNIEDDIAPIMNVELPEGTLPKGRVGYSYPIFDVTAEDNFSGVVPVKKSVYYLKDTNRYSVTIKDNAFVPTKAGTYIIKYEASDRVGNVTTRELEIEVVDRNIPISIFLDGEIPTTVKRGEVIYFPEISVIGGSGALRTTYNVTHNGAPVENDGKCFIPRETGSYIFGVSVIDYIGQTAYKSFTYNIVDNSDVVFYSNPELPKYFISGYKYDLPALYGVDYGNNASTVLADVEITMNGKTTTQKSGTDFVPTVNNNGDIITVKYMSRSQTFINEIPTIINKADNILQIDRYFDSKGLNIDVNHEDRSILSADQSGEVSATFINPLVANLLSLQLTPTANSNFEELQLTLTDEFNSEERVVIRLTRSPDNKIIMVIGNNSTKFDFSFSNQEEMFEISYSDGVVHLGNGSLAFDKFDNGEEFTGFSSHYVYLTITLVGANIGSSISLNRICNQPIYSIPFDFSKPLVYFTGETGGYYHLDYQYDVVIALFFDVLIPNVSSTISVFAPNGEYAKDVDGVVIEELRSDRHYSFILEEYGVYTVSYMANDGRNRLNTGYDVGISIEYELSISVTSSYKTSIQLGEKIVVPDYEIKYNGNIEEVSTYVTIRSPEGSITILSDGNNAYVPKYKGEYYVNINAFDAAGNVALFSYIVTVK